MTRTLFATTPLDYSRCHPDAHALCKCGALCNDHRRTA